MKKLFLFLVVLLVSFSSAMSANQYTAITGNVTDAFTGQLLGGVDISVVCNHNGTYYTKTVQIPTEQGKMGYYAVTFFASQCYEGDSVEVSATLGNLYGSNWGTVNGTRLDFMDIAIVNVPLVPEFGFLIGMLTIVSAVGVFFFVRRE